MPAGINVSGDFAVLSLLLFIMFPLLVNTFNTV